MYIVKLLNDGIETPIHDEKEKLKSGSVVKGINAIDSFTFTILPSNAGFNRISDFQTLVTVYNTNRNRYEFMGRVLHSQASMDSNGLISKQVTCESYMGYFCDSQQSYVTERNWTVTGLLQHIIDKHNSQVEDYKRFSIGEVTVTDPNDNLYIGIQRDNTWKTISEKLTKKLGGEIRFRVVDGVNYLDYLTEIGATRATKIALSRNMKSISKESDPSKYVTRLIPLGCKLNGTEERLTIADANNGLEYIDDEAAIRAYGIHVGYVEFDDVTYASILKTKGENWLVENNKVQIKYSITALDLSLLGLDIDDFDVHNYHPIENSLLGIDDVARIIKKTIDVCKEVSSTIEVGDNFKTLSDLQQEKIEEATENMQQVIQSTANNLRTEISNSVESLDQRIIEQNTNVVNSCYEIILEAMESYVQTNDYETFKSVVSSQLEILKDQVEISLTTSLERTSEVNDVLQSQIDEITTYFRFTEDGQYIGRSDSEMQTRFANAIWEFLLNGVRQLYIDPDGVHGRQIHTDSIHIGDLVFQEQPDGSVIIS